MAKYRTINQVEEDYFRNHPEEIDEYIEVIFDEYSLDGNIGALLSSLRMISRIKGISLIAESSGITRNGVQKALSQDGNPGFASINSIMHAMGYKITPQRLDPLH